MAKTSQTVFIPEIDLQDSDILQLDRRHPCREIDFLGVAFAPMDFDTLFERAVQKASERTSFAYLVTPNVDQIVRLHANPLIAPLLEDAWLRVNDSRILQTLASFSHIDLPACPGSDLSSRLLNDVIQGAETVVIIGCTRDVVDAVTARFRLTDVRWHEPPMGLRNNPQAIAAAAEFCAQNPARFHFLCVGNPQQEMIAQAIKARGDGVGLGLCVGASLEFLAGKRARAPKWMQQMRLEWLFRLLSEPKVLWRRYLVEGPKIFMIWQKWRKSTQ